MKQIFKIKLNERAIQAKIKSAQIIFDQEIALWHVIVQKGSAEIETYSIISPYDFYKVYRFWEGEVDHIFLEEDIDQHFEKAKEEWERIRALARMHELPWLDAPYMFAAANKLDVFLLTDRLQNSIVYGFRFIHNSVNSLDIGVITLSENIANIMREDYTSSIGSFFGFSTDCRKTAYIVFYEQFEEVLKNFLESSFWFDGEPKELEFGIVTSAVKGILSIKNGDFEINVCASPFRKDLFTIYEDALTNRPPICVPDFPYATWYANRNNIVFK